jgi:uncharacterized protein YciI
MVGSMIAVLLELSKDPRRLAARPAHRELLARLHAEGRLVAAGPWPDDSGALLLFTGQEPDVRQILADDPYYATPGVTVMAVHTWNPVVGRLD